MNNIMIGVIRKSECQNDVLIPNNISDKVIGDMFADLTMILYKKYPAALEVATKMLERINYDEEHITND